MNKFRMIALLLCMSMVLSLAGCGANSTTSTIVTDSSAVVTDSSADTQTDVSSTLSKIDNSKWQYNSENGVYWQVGISYCSNPADSSYETMGVFVPEAYMTAVDNGDGTFTCEINLSAKIGDYTAETAPIVIPINTPGYSAMSAPTDYVSEASTYTQAGFIYVNAGCRGRDAGAPSGVTDLKAAVRYVRYSSDTIPGDTDRIFTFGMSGGGAQSALMGATGDSELYNSYLESIGAVMDESDAVAGSMCWCPITNLDTADEAYEWNLGVTRSGLSDEMQSISDGLAEAYASYINDLGLKDESGNVLTLTESDAGIYQAGTYYDYLKSVVETSLNNFLSDTTFPYDASSSSTHINIGDMGKKDGNGPDGTSSASIDGDLHDFDSSSLPSDSESEQYAKDGIDRSTSSSGLNLSGTYETAQDYIDALNADTTWVSYDSSTNTATITSIADFVKACKNASKDLGAFDQLDAGQGENTLFGYGDGNGSHFDATLASLLQDTEYYDSYKSDLEKTDSQGNSVQTRLNMYNPMYYLCDYYDGNGTSNVAKYWRIRTGINQSDTALCTEVNLALALEANGEQVDFATVWGQGHTEAERSGTSSENFISWVNDCLSEN